MDKLYRPLINKLEMNESWTHDKHMKAAEFQQRPPTTHYSPNSLSAFECRIFSLSASDMGADSMKEAAS